MKVYVKKIISNKYVQLVFVKALTFILLYKYVWAAKDVKIILLLFQ